MMRSGKRWLIGIAGGAVFLLVLGFMLFAAVAMREPVDSAAAADGIVVLTGTDSRIVEGGRLLKQGRAKRMLISGVNRQTSRTDLQRISGMDRQASNVVSTSATRRSTRSAMRMKLVIGSRT